MIDLLCAAMCGLLLLISAVETAAVEIPKGARGGARCHPAIHSIDGEMMDAAPAAGQPEQALQISEKWAHRRGRRVMWIPRNPRPPYPPGGAGGPSPRSPWRFSRCPAPARPWRRHRCARHRSTWREIGVAASYCQPGPIACIPPTSPPTLCPCSSWSPTGWSSASWTDPPSNGTQVTTGMSTSIEHEEGLGWLAVSVLTIDDGVPTGAAAPIDTGWKIHPTIPPRSMPNKWKRTRSGCARVSRPLPPPSGSTTARRPVREADRRGPEGSGRRSRRISASHLGMRLREMHRQAQVRKDEDGTYRLPDADP